MNGKLFKTPKKPKWLNNSLLQWEAYQQQIQAYIGYTINDNNFDDQLNEIDAV